MKVGIIAIGSHGDVRPYVALGLGLQAAGYEVRVVTHAAFGDFVRARGLAVSELDGDPQSIAASEDGMAWLGSGRNALAFALRTQRLIVPLMGEYVTGCWRACQDAGAIVASGLGFFFGLHIAERLAVPFFPAYLAPITPTNAFPNAFVPSWPGGGWLNLATHFLYWHVSWPLLRKETNRLRQDVLGLRPLPLGDPFGGMYRQALPMLYGYSPSVVPKPPDWLDWIHVTGYWFLPPEPDWRPSPALVDFLAAGPPPVCVGFGSMVDREPAEVTEMVVDALALAGQRGVLLTGWGGLSGAALSDDVFATESVPHEWLFPRATAVVHHGGAGTTAAALRAGVPSAIVPFFADQYFWGQVVHGLGVGARPLMRRQLSTARLAEVIRAAAGDGDLRRRAAALGARIRAEDGVGRAVAALREHLAPAQGPHVALAPRPDGALASRH